MHCHAHSMGKVQERSLLKCSLGVSKSSVLRCLLLRLSAITQTNLDHRPIKHLQLTSWVCHTAILQLMPGVGVRSGT
jgi:hypothetical protein